MAALARRCSNSSGACVRRCRRATLRAKRRRSTRRSPRSRRHTGHRIRPHARLRRPDADLGWNRKARRAAGAQGPPAPAIRDGPPPRCAFGARPDCPFDAIVSANGRGEPARTGKCAGSGGPCAATAAVLPGEEPASGEPPACANAAWRKASRDSAGRRDFPSAVTTGRRDGQFAFLRIEDRPGRSASGREGQ